MNQALRYVTLLMILTIVPAGAQAFPWNEDMRDAPSVKPQEALVYSNPTSVPSGIDEPLDKPKDLSTLVRARLQAGVDLVNPVAESVESLNRGKEVYTNHCASCHGDTGVGDGLVGQKYMPQPMNLLTDYIQQQPPGRIFYTITYGGIAMPLYRGSITIGDRWHLVNYVKNRLEQGTE